MNTTESSDIYNDIHHLTHIPQCSVTSNFIPLNRPGRGIEDRLMNERSVRFPRNIELVEETPVVNTDFTIEDFPTEDLLFAQIRQVNGVDYSNHFIETHWLEQDSDISSNTDGNLNNSFESLKKSALLENGLDNSCSAASESSSSSNEEKQQENNRSNPETSDTLSRSRLSKNAVISGLLKKNFITLEDLDLEAPQNQTNGSPSRASKIQSLCEELDELDLLYDYDTEDPSNSDDFDNTNFLNLAAEEESKTVNALVPHPNEPEVFVHPTQVLLHGSNNSADFPLESVGEKKTVTPRQYFMTEVDNSFFDFHGRKPKSCEKVKRQPKKRSYKEQTYATPVQTDFAPKGGFNPFAIKNDEFVLKKDDFPPL